MGKTLVWPGDKKGPLTCADVEPEVGLEPTACALRERFKPASAPLRARVNTGVNSFGGDEW